MIAIDLAIILAVAVVWLLRSSRERRLSVVAGAVVAMLVPIVDSAVVLADAESGTRVRIDGSVVTPANAGDGVWIGAGCDRAALRFAGFEDDALATFCVRARRASRPGQIVLDRFDGVSAIDVREHRAWYAPLTPAWRPLRGAVLEFGQPVALPGGDTLRLARGGPRGELRVGRSASLLSDVSDPVDQRLARALVSGRSLCELPFAGGHRPPCDVFIASRARGLTVLGNILPLPARYGGPRFTVDMAATSKATADTLIVQSGDTLRVLARGGASWTFVIERRAVNPLSPSDEGIAIRTSELWRRSSLGVPPGGHVTVAARRLPSPAGELHIAFGQGLDTTQFALLGRIERVGDGADMVVGALRYRLDAAGTVVPASVIGGDARAAGVIVAARPTRAASALRFFLQSAVLVLLTLAGGALALGRGGPISVAWALAALGWTALMTWRVILGARVSIAAPFLDRATTAAPAAWIGVIIAVVVLARLDLVLPWIERAARTARLPGWREPSTSLAPVGTTVLRSERVVLRTLTVSIIALLLIDWQSAALGAFIAGLAISTISVARLLVSGASAWHTPGAALSIGALLGGPREDRNDLSGAPTTNAGTVLEPVMVAATLLMATKAPVLVGLAALASMIALRSRRLQRLERFRRHALAAAAASALVIGANELGARPVLTFLLAITVLLLTIAAGSTVRAAVMRGNATGVAWWVSLLPFVVAGVGLVAYAAVDFGLVLVAAPALIVAATLSIGWGQIPWAARSVLAVVMALALYAANGILRPDTARMADQSLPIDVRIAAFEEAGGPASQFLRDAGFATPMDRAITRALAATDPAALECIYPLLPPSSAADAIPAVRAHIEGMRRAANAGWFGAGLGQGTAISQGVPLPVVAAESAFSGLVVAEHGFVGGLSLLLPYLLIAVAGLLSWHTLRKGGARPVTDGVHSAAALIASASIWAAFQSGYVALSNLMVVPLTGEDLVALNPTSYSAALLAVALTAFMLVPMRQADEAVRIPEAQESQP